MYRLSFPAIQRTLSSLLLLAGFPAYAVDFQQDIQPLLADRCFACHGPDAAQRKGKLRLDQEADAKESAIVAGAPDTSELLKRILSKDPEEQMPPPESQKAPLTPEEAALIREWIAEGAPWEGHWAFTPPTKTPLPPVQHAAWPRNDMDRFILAKTEARGLTPAPEASRETLIRRVTLDLTGLPPTPEAIDQFLLDNSSDAYERLVDRLLASPAYGEHLARTWLDGARYADTNGYQNDFHRVMWPWRDWVIGAFNDNMPYDQFVMEQIAGDLLPHATESQRIATGFNRNNKSVTEGGSIEEEWLVENLVDRVETTSTLLLGLSMGCARCHDHKYDPISQRSFYEFYAFFNSTEDRGFYQETRGNAGPQVQLPSFQQQQQLAKLDQAVADAQKALEEARATGRGDYDAWLSGLASPATMETVPTLEAPLNGTLAIANRAEEGTAAKPAWKSGPLGSVLALDGTAESTVALGQTVTPKRTAPFSIALWVRPETTGALWSKMDESQDYRGVDALVTGNGNLEVHMVSKWDSDALKVSANDVLTLGQWSHVAITSDGTGKAAGLQLFVNGTSVATTVLHDSLSGPIDTEEPFRIGQRTASTYLKGEVAGLSVFDVALNESQWNAHIDALFATLLPETIPDDLAEVLREYHGRRVALHTRPYQIAEDAATKARNDFAKDIPSVMVMQERAEPRPTYLLQRGAYDAPDTSEVLNPNTPDFLPPLPEGAPQNRLGLAQWLVAPENPLTARVAVNRFWQMTFGKGLVKTAEDFGVQGSPPTHPDLLDALAVHFVESGWDVKGLFRELVTSATYRQSSELTEQLRAVDPENRLYARAPRYRLTAEMLRDNALAISGLLTAKRGGPPAMPYQPPGLWEELAGGASQGPYKQGTGEDLYRRSIYTHRKRTVPHPTLSTFDAPSFEVCLARRGRTNTPLQALALLNDTTYVEAARHLAQRMLLEVEGNMDERVDYGFRLATGRLPTPSEGNTLRQGLEAYRAHYSADPDAATALIANGESDVPSEIPSAELAAYMPLASVLLNLDETLTRE